jgi:hypothetical protein
VKESEESFEILGDVLIPYLPAEKPLKFTPY